MALGLVAVDDGTIPTVCLARLSSRRAMAMWALAAMFCACVASESLAVIQSLVRAPRRWWRTPEMESRRERIIRTIVSWRLEISLVARAVISFRVLQVGGACRMHRGVGRHAEISRRRALACDSSALSPAFHLLAAPSAWAISCLHGHGAEGSVGMTFMMLTRCLIREFR